MTKRRGNKRLSLSKPITIGKGLGFIAGIKDKAHKIPKDGTGKSV